jgi:hypothetical protein
MFRRLRRATVHWQNGISATRLQHFVMPFGRNAMSVNHTNLLKMLTITDDGPVVLSPSGKRALRWAVSMINALGEEVADQSGLPIPEVLQRVSNIVEQSEEFNWQSKSEAECERCGIGFRLPSGRCDHCEHYF